MASNVVKLFIGTVSGSNNLQPITSGSYDLRVSPFSSTGIAGTYSSGGWIFTGLDDTAEYKLYETGVGEFAGFIGGGSNTKAFYDSALQSYIRHNGTIAFSANQPMGGFIFTGMGAGSATGHSVRYEQVVRIADSQTITGAKTLDGTVPAWITMGTNLAGEVPTPSNSGHLVPKKYVDDLFGGAVGVVQSTYLNKLIPLRAIEDSYSHTTLELCNTYLSGLTSISSRTGVLLIEPMGTTANQINADDGTSQWISSGVYIVGVGKRPIINRRAPNTSLTVAGGITNCRILDNAVAASRAYTSFVFQDVEFSATTTPHTFTNCKFKGICKFKGDPTSSLIMTNCTGDIMIYNDDITTVTITGTQPADIKGTNVLNFDY